MAEAQGEGRVSGSAGSFRRRVLSGGLWAGLLNGFERGLGLARTAVLARLLAPADFGLFGIALFSIQALKSVSEPGIDKALISDQREELDDYLDTSWWIKLARAALLAGLLLLAAPWIAGFFGEADAKPVLQVLSAFILLAGLRNPALVYFEKRLDFKTLFYYHAAAAGAGFVVAVVSAYLDPSVWALVHGLLAGETVRVIGSHLVTDFRPGFGFRADRARELLSFGKWVFASHVVIFLATQGDDGFIGWYLTPAALGLYQLAFQFSNAPATELTHVAAKVLLPSFSALQRDRERLRRAYDTAMRVLAMLVMPMAVGLVLVAEPFTRVVLGEKWLGMVPAFQVLSAGVVFRALPGFSAAVYNALGEPRWNFYENLVRLMTLVATLLPFTRAWGITGAAMSVALAVASAWVISVPKVLQFTGLPPGRFVQNLAVPAAASGLMIAPVAFIGTAVDGWLGLGLMIGGGVVSYALALEATFRLMGDSLVSAARRALGT